MQSTMMVLRRRRIIVLVASLLLFYLFLRDTSAVTRPFSQRFNPVHTDSDGLNNEGYSDVERVGEVTPGHTYEGPIKFPNLKVSMYEFGLQRALKGHVLFAFSSLKSGSGMIAMACEMASYNRSLVHVAVMGRSSIGLDDLLNIHHIDASDCPVIWHNAQPDVARDSSNERMELSVRAGLAHINSILQIHAVLVEEPTREDDFFNLSINDKAAALKIPVVIIPSYARSNLGWIAGLDSASLQHWNSVKLDIVIRPSAGSTGSLVRLLKSIRAADYTAMNYPSITVELPAEVDVFTSDFLTRFQWPPGFPPAESKLTVRRRISGQKAGHKLAALQTLESFYPARPATSHVLLLNPDVELSRSYLHYLTFCVLEYKYSTLNTGISASIAGISLEVPTRNLADADINWLPRKEDSIPFVLWQSPAPNAALYFGDTWHIFHRFISERLDTDPELSKSVKDLEIANHQPLWMKEIAQVLQATGTFMLYPTFTLDDDSQIATIHQELYEEPEENHGQDNDNGILLNEQLERLFNNEIPFTGESEVQLMAEQRNREMQQTTSASFSTGVRKFSRLRTESGTQQLSLFEFDGRQISTAESGIQAVKHADHFSLAVGGCKKLDDRDSSQLGMIEYLFCHG